MVLPAYMGCSGRRSPLSVIINVAVTLDLSAEPTIGTNLHPFLPNVCRPDGTYFDGI